MTFSLPPNHIIWSSLLIFFGPFLVGMYLYYVKKIKYEPFKDWNYFDKYDQVGPTAKEVSKFYKYFNQTTSEATVVSYFDWQLFLSVLIGLQKQSYKSPSSLLSREVFTSFREECLDAFIRGIELSWCSDSPPSTRFTLLDAVIWRVACQVFTDEDLKELLTVEAHSIPAHENKQVIEASFETLLSLFRDSSWRRNKKVAEEMRLEIANLKANLPPTPKGERKFSVIFSETPNCVDMPINPAPSSNHPYTAEHVPEPIENWFGSKRIRIKQ